MHIAGSDKPVFYYGLDAVISVGYRVNSRRGTEFRIWATGVLKDHILKGYTLNERRLKTQVAARSGGFHGTERHTRIRCKEDARPAAAQVSRRRVRLRGEGGSGGARHGPGRSREEQSVAR
ncbi:MAG: RhuM family protein [bacterium]